MVAVCSIKSSFDILGVTKLVFWDEDVVQLVGVSFHRWCSGGESQVLYLRLLSKKVLAALRLWLLIMFNILWLFLEVWGLS